MKHTIVTYLHSMGEFEMAEEVISMHNRLEAFAGRLDKAALDAAISAAEEAIRQRDELLAAANAAIDWSRDRKNIMPYRVRDPLVAAVIFATKGLK